MERTIKRGEIYYAELNPVIGSEQGGNRPVLIISNDIGNKHSPTVIVAAITSKQTKHKIPTHCYLTNVEGMPADSIVLLEQLRTLDKKRLGERLRSLMNLIWKQSTIPFLSALVHPLKGGAYEFQ